MQCAIGSGFGPSGGTVTINGVTATPASWSDTEVCTFLRGVGVGPGSIQISSAGGASNAVSFAVVADRAVTGVQPRSAGVGSQVTITGTSLGSLKGSVLLYGGSSGPATLGIVSWSGTQIVATVPPGVQPGSYNLQVSAEGTTANGGPFFVVTAPQINSVQWDPTAVDAMQCAIRSGFGPSGGTAT